MSRKKRQRGKKNEKRAWGKSQGKKGLYVAVLLLALALVVGGGWLLNQRQQVSAATPAEVAAEIIPQEGDPTTYGIPLSRDNTQQFTGLKPHRGPFTGRRNSLRAVEYPLFETDVIAGS